MVRERISRGPAGVPLHHTRIARIVPPGLEGTAQAIYGTVGIGAANALLTLVSGLLYARLGAQGFWITAALCVLALPLTWKLRQSRLGESHTL